MVTLTKKRSINNQIEKSVNSKRMYKTKKEIQKRYAMMNDVAIVDVEYN